MTSWFHALIELQLQGKQAHWNVVGKNLRDTHRMLDESIEDARTFSDTVDLIVARLEATVGTVRGVHDQVDDEDPTSSDILHAILERLEQFAWMVSAENRTPRAAN